MSWSLQLRHGDLALNGTSLATARGGDKLIQDLRCALLERMGTDPMHEDYGSLIDGGRRSDGTEVQSLIGGNHWDMIVLTVESEILRIATQQQHSQLARAQADQMKYGKTTLSGDEILASVQSVQVQQVQDKLVATVAIVTGFAEPQVLTIPLSSEPVIA